MGKSRSSISQAQTYKGIGDFWDTHDLADYWDQTKPVDFEIAIGDLLVSLSARLGAKSDTPSLDAQVLLAQVTGRPRAWVLAHPEATLTQPQQAALDKSLARLERGEPLPYVLGHWEFFGLDFIVTPDVLIPRPETELLVETAISWLGQRLALSHGDAARKRQAAITRSDKSDLLAVDVGTGCGCIAVALAVNIPDLHVTATDISAKALKIARRNAEKFNVANRIEFLEADLLPLTPTTLPSGEGPRQREPSAFDLQPYDLICANLPYIPTATLQRLPVYQREPTLALDGGADGLDIIRRLLVESPRHLAPGGLILVEIEASQGLAALALAYDAFAEAEISLHPDLAGRDRLIEIAPKDDG